MQILDRVFASAYDRVMAAPEARGLKTWRAELIGPLRGRVLEIGAGTGLSLPHYQDDVEVVALEPDPFMLAQLKARADEVRPSGSTTVVQGVAEELPFEKDSFDAVVLGLVLCTVADPPAALAEVRRVLRPGGKAVFIEHVRARTQGTYLLQRVIEPVWTICGRGCRLTRDTESTLREAGFEFETLDHSDLPGGIGFLKAAIHGVAR